MTVHYHLSRISAYFFDNKKLVYTLEYPTVANVLLNCYPTVANVLFNCLLPNMHSVFVKLSKKKPKCGNCE